LHFAKIRLKLHPMPKTVLPTTFPGLRVLVVEDLVTLAIQYKTLAARLEVEVVTVNTQEWALKKTKEGPWHAALVDLNLPDGNGFTVIEALLQYNPACSPVVITGEDTLDNAMRASEAGAFDYIEKPVEAERLLVTLRNALHAAQLSQKVARLESAAPIAFEQFTGQSAVMQTVYRTIETVAPSNAPICITGESGTGKELAANAIHARSPRRAKNLVPINCAAIPVELIESELFGHVKGAFTGAVTDRLGAFIEADKGTLFLDEIAELDMSVQAKLLRVLQTGEVKRLGEDRTRIVDVRVVCASHRDLREQVRQGAFREDLFYRLYVVPIELPPLRARGEDITLIARELLKRYAKEDGKGFADFSPEAMQRMRAYDWPGNVRELVNVIRAVVALYDGERVEEYMLPAALGTTTSAAPADLWFQDAPAAKPITESPAPLANRYDPAQVRPLAQIEREVVDYALRAFDGNVAKAARALQVNASTLYRKIQVWTAQEST
jgi:two-component system, repressor protein LuxO